MLEAILLAVMLCTLQLLGKMNPLLFVLSMLTLGISVPFFRMYFMNAPPFVPTNPKRVRTMMDLANIKPGEKIYDLGCGDGRILRAAAKKGAMATGFELSIPTFALAKLLSFRTPNVTIRYQDFWKQDYHGSDVIFCFLLPDLMPKFGEKIWTTLKPGTRVVSNAFHLPGVTPVKKENGVFLYQK